MSFFSICEIMMTLLSVFVATTQKTKITESSPITSWQIDKETMETVTDFIFLGSKITADGDCSHEIKSQLLLRRKAMTKLDSILKSRDNFANKDLCSQSYDFSSSHLQMWELDHKEGWVPKNWCFSIVLEKMLERPLDSKEIKPVNPKGNYPWIFIGRTDAEVEAPILWPPDVKTWFTGKDSCWERLKAKRRGRQRMRWLDNITNSIELFEQTPGVSGGQRSLVCCSPWGLKELDLT